MKKRVDDAVRFHDLRHTVVTRMLENGVPLAALDDFRNWLIREAV